jgi:ribosomal protein S18 acetylase RimI-like enzyme
MTELSPEIHAARKRAAAAPRRAAMADAPAVSRTLARSFAADPVVDWFVRADDKRDKAMGQWFDFAVKKLGLPGGETWMSDDANAVALWIPPPQAAMQLSLVDEITAIPMFLSVVSLQRLGRMQRLRAAFDANHPKAPHWYLFFLAVDPDCQGQGLGSAILGATLDAIDAKHEAAYLEASSEKNVPLYLRYGFEILSEFRPEPAGPKIWGMWRRER